jgi:two-component system heavy metal sensor histidine kinase CusS
MRSIGFRISIWYALAATFSLIGLSIGGYVLLEKHLFDGLDLLNESEFQQISTRLGPEYQNISAPFIEMRIRETTESASTLFYIEIQKPNSEVVFRSSNLKNSKTPEFEVPSKFNAVIPEIGEVRVATFPMQPFKAMIATPLHTVRDVMSSYIRVCAALLTGMLLASLVIGLMISRMLLAPIRIIRDTADRIRFDNLSERIQIGEVKDEVTDLAVLLNQMFDRIEASFTQVNRFTAEASHELRTPLTLIRLHSESIAKDDSTDIKTREKAQTLIEEVDRLTQIIDNLLFLSRADAQAVSLDLKPHSIKKFLDNFKQDALVLAENSNNSFELLTGEDREVNFDPRTMRQVLLNLLSNAIQASPDKGKIVLSSFIKESHWLMTMEDEGKGLAPEECEKIFGRFVRFTNFKDQSQGSGLGLAICRSIVQLHHGKINATASQNLSGLKIEIKIPCHGDSFFT